MKIGKIKESAEDSWSLLAGIEIAFIKDSKECLVIRPIKLEEMEKFYKTLHEEFGKDDFFDNYDEFVCYAADKDCDDIILTLHESDLEDIRSITVDEIKEHNKNLEQLLKIHYIKNGGF